MESTMKTVEPALSTSAREPRDSGKERRLAKERQAMKLGDIAVARHDGTLGEEYIKLAQAMILCTLPHSQTAETRITRRARLGDGSVLSVTFSAARENTSLPFGADRKLLAWIFDKAIRADSPWISWTSATEYQREMGLPIGGSGNRDLRKRFDRVSGLVINIQRQTERTTREIIYPIMAGIHLPSSVTGMPADEDQTSFPELADRFGFKLNPDLFEDIRKYHIVLPRKLWQEITGPTQVQDIVYWLIFRCYSAASESIIPWTALSEQFPQDKNPRRTRAHARQAIAILGTLWPTVRLLRRSRKASGYPTRLSPYYRMTPRRGGSVD